MNHGSLPKTVDYQTAFILLTTHFWIFRTTISYGTTTYNSEDPKGSRTREGEGNKVWDHMDLDMWPNCFLCSTECIYDASIHNYTIRHGLPTLSTLEPRKRFIRFLWVQRVPKTSLHYNNPPCADLKV